jgi:hypothetical protein
MTVRITTIVVLLLSLSPCSTAQMPKAIWSLDVSSHAAYREAAGTENADQWLHIAFVDDNSIIVAAEFQSTPGWRLGSGEPNQFLLTNNAILAVDSVKGTIQHFQVFKGWRGPPAMFSSGAAYSTGTADCLVNIGDELLRLSPTLEVAARRKLPLSRRNIDGYRYQDHWSILTDPRTKKALLAHFLFPPNGSGDAHWLSVETLEDEQVNPILVFGWQGAALVGDSLVFGATVPAREPARIQRGEGQPHPLCAKCLGPVNGSFGNGLIFLSFHSYQVVDVNGTIRYRGKKVGGRADTIGGVSGAVTSNRVAFRFGHLGREEEDTVVVLDMDAKKKEVMRFELHQPPEIKTFGRMVKETFKPPSLALSPDGRKLAVLTGSVVTLYDVP